MKKIIYIILCIALYGCNNEMDTFCQNCTEIESYEFDFTFLFPEYFERTYDFGDFCHYQDYTPHDVIVIKEKEKKWEDSRVKVCINLDSLSFRPDPISGYLDDVQKYILTSTECKRKTLTKNWKSITFVEYLDKESNILTIISYYYNNNFLIRKKIEIQKFKIEDYELIELLLFG